ncbi:hypothetical protein VUR80DRAFT_8172 [Thermomyces stellatus]
MAVPNVALEKLVREIGSQAAAAEQQINLCRGQVASKQREMRLLKLTLDEVSSIPRNTHVYEGVGKMFVATPIPSLSEKLEGQVKTLDEELEKLRKRLIYLETTQKNSRDHIEQMFKQGAGRG